ncbi:MAG TPA: hypothetical protein PKY86_05340 [Niabella sp.]|nr:hypothetical protein [Niabella sp.]HQX21428.1 hypothetical protein [Niabella sp.]HQX73461.1 hypothetical protein [Chitinophagaceae bacterium]HRB36130.1 hypothetical protein [Niabella sp.]HRB79611.1 hypothetical protein [Niabella sp.]
MKQMKIPAAMQIDIDFEQDDLSKAVKDLHPVLWHDGQGYCCLLGPDPQEGILGCGMTKEEALSDWEINLRERVQTAGADDEVGQYVIDTLKISKKDVW